MAEAKDLPWEAAFVHRMKTLRERDDVSQTELAKAAAAKGLPFHQQTIQRIETGIRPVRLNEAVVLAEILGSSLDAMTQADTVDSLRKEAMYNVYRVGNFLNGIGEQLKQQQAELEHLLKAATEAQERYLIACSQTGEKGSRDDQFIERQVEEGHKALEVMRESAAAWLAYEQRYVHSSEDFMNQVEAPRTDNA
jgi:DNA-binding XRE family transcriptional regulator